MKVARLAVLAVALSAGVAAAFLVGGSKAPEQQASGPSPVAPPPIATDDVLVAGHDLPLGTLVNAADMQWQAWPKDSTSAGMIRKSETPNASTDIAGSIARGAFLQGEPMRREKLVKGTGSGFLSAILPAGYRAVSVEVNASGNNTAGGFILPNDRVDVVRTARDEDATKAAGSDVFVSEAILQNIRVLAIGQNVQEQKGQPTVTGVSNATLEVDPRQAEALIQAQRTGTLSLVLRSMLDANAPATTDADSGAAPPAMTVVRYGVAVQAGKR